MSMGATKTAVTPAAPANAIWLRMQAAVAEQYVEQLRGIVADGLLPQSDAHFEQVFFFLSDCLDLSDDLRLHEGIIDRTKRHLYALLDGKRTRASFYGTGRAMD